MKVLKELRSCSWHDVPKRADVGHAKAQMIHQSHDGEGRLRTIEDLSVHFLIFDGSSCVSHWSSKLWRQIVFYQNPRTKIILPSCPVWSLVFKVDGQQGSSRTLIKEDIRDFQSTFWLFFFFILLQKKKSMFLCVRRNSPLVIFFKIMQLCCNYVS